MSIQQNYQAILSQLPENVKLVTVSKTNPAEKIKEVYDLGQRAFGENKVQELLEKQPVLPNDIEWHLIGHLQTNKVRGGKWPQEASDECFPHLNLQHC